MNHKQSIFYTNLLTKELSRKKWTRVDAILDVFKLYAAWPTELILIPEGTPKRIASTIGWFNGMGGRENCKNFKPRVVLNGDVIPY